MTAAWRLVHMLDVIRRGYQEYLSLSLPASLSPSTVLFSALPLQHGPPLRQVWASSSNSAALVKILHLTLVHHGARYAASLTALPVAHKCVMTI